MEQQVNKDLGGIKMVNRDAYISYLNDLDFALVKVLCENCDLEVVIEDGRITDYINRKEVK